MTNKVVCNAEDLTAIADAIRASSGSTETFNVPELSAAAVNAIGTSGGWDGDLKYDSRYGVDIGRYTFYANEYVKNINIPFCKGIDYRAFFGCHNLDTVYLAAPYGTGCRVVKSP